jgi:putative SOS response-associated peptidase YedK
MAVMCSRYRPSDPAVLAQHFMADTWRRQPVQGELKPEAFPGYKAPFIRRPPERSSGDEAVPDREAVVGLFGLLPFWAKDTKLTKSTYNARSETVATKPSFRDAWKRAQHCIVPAAAFYEPDWRTGKHIPTRISRADGKPMGIAGLWERWKSPVGEEVFSFTMLTVNADTHPVMCAYHRPDDEKRMIVLLREDDYDAWLDAPAERSMDFMRQCPPEELVAVGEPKERAA